MCKPAPIQRCRPNRCKASKPHACKLPDFYKHHDEIVKKLEKLMRFWVHYDRCRRIAQTIHYMGRSKHPPKDWWEAVPGFTKKKNEHEAQYRRVLKAKKAILRHYYKDLTKIVLPDLEKYHKNPYDCLEAIDRCLNKVITVPDEETRKFFDKHIYPSMFDSTKTPWTKVLGNIWKGINEVKGTYLGIVTKVAPYLALKHEKWTCRALNKILIRGKTYGGKAAEKIGLSVVEATYAQIMPELKNYPRNKAAAVMINKKLRYVQFDVGQHTYMGPVINGILAGIAWTITIYKWKKDGKIQTTLKDLLGYAAGACALLEAGSSFVVVRCVRQRVAAQGLKALPDVYYPQSGLYGNLFKPTKVPPLQIRFWSTFNKIVGTVGAVIAVVCFVVDANENWVTADYDAAIFCGVGVVGSVMMLFSATTGYGLIICLIAFVGLMLTDDDEWLTWAKTCPYGKAWRDSWIESEKKMKKLLEKNRKEQEKLMRKVAKELRTRVQVAQPSGGVLDASTQKRHQTILYNADQFELQAILLKRG